MNNWFSSVKSLLEEISGNTHPLEFIHGNLGYWSFGVASVSLFIALFALYYQKKATDNLDKIVPGQIRLEEVGFRLQRAFLDVEAIFFGMKPYKDYPVSFVLSSLKLPEDLIILKTFENKRRCYDEAFKLKLAWRDFNLYVDKMIEYSSISSDDVVENFAGILQTYIKYQLRLVYKFERTLIKENIIKQSMPLKERLAGYLLNTFFEGILGMKNVKESNIDTSRKNFKAGQKKRYLSLPFVPKTIDLEEYIKNPPPFTLADYEDDDSDAFNYKPEFLIEDIKEGNFDFINQFLHVPPTMPISKVDFSIFYNAYYNYIEPVILCYLRYAYYLILHPEYDESEVVTKNESEVPSNSPIGKQQNNRAKTKGKKQSKKEKLKPITTNKNKK